MTDGASLAGIDKVLLEVLRNRFQAIVDEMGYVVLRTGHTVFVKETGDFGVALASRQGEVFATPYRVGVHLMVGLPLKDSLRYVEERLGGFHEGDVFLSNDPVTTGGMATHLPDIYIWKPIFNRGNWSASAGASSISRTSAAGSQAASRRQTPKPFRKGSSSRRFI